MKFHKKLLSLKQLFKIFKEGNPSATAVLQGALHLTINICNVKSNTKIKVKKKVPNYNYNNGYLWYTKRKTCLQNVQNSEKAH